MTNVIIRSSAVLLLAGFGVSLTILNDRTMLKRLYEQHKEAYVHVYGREVCIYTNSNKRKCRQSHEYPLPGGDH